MQVQHQHAPHICSECGSWLHQARPARLEDVPGFEYAKRALEVALAGNHSIAFFYVGQGTRPYGEDLANWAAEHKLVVWLEAPCPCGNRGSRVEMCACRNGGIVKHQQSRDYQLALEADIVIQLQPPYPEVVVAAAFGRRRGEPDEHILQRVGDANGREVGDDLDQVCQHLLKSALRQNYISGARVPAVLAVAKTIARLADESSIHAAHLAEALQYRPGEDMR